MNRLKIDPLVATSRVRHAVLFKRQSDWKLAVSIHVQVYKRDHRIESASKGITVEYTHSSWFILIFSSFFKYLCTYVCMYPNKFLNSYTCVLPDLI